MVIVVLPVVVGGDEAERSNRQRRAGQRSRDIGSYRLVGTVSRSGGRGVIRDGGAAAGMDDSDGDGDDEATGRTMTTTGLGGQSDASDALDGSHGLYWLLDRCTDGS